MEVARHICHISGQIIIFHRPRFSWNKGISLTKPPFGVRSCEVAIIWADILIYIYISYIYIAIYPNKQMYNTLGLPPTQKYIGLGYLDLYIVLWGVICYLQYHLVREPETTIDRFLFLSQFWAKNCCIHMTSDAYQETNGWSSRMLVTSTSKAK